MKDRTRILFLGFSELPEQSSDEFHRKWQTKRVKYGRKSKYEWEEGISLFDYNILFVDCIGTFPDGLEQELSSFLGDGGIMCLFVCPDNAGLIRHYIRSDVTVQGTAMKPLKSNHWLWSIINDKNNGFRWSSILSPGQYVVVSEYDRTASEVPRMAMAQVQDVKKSDLFEKVALTPNNKCITAILMVGKGKIIALPHPCNMHDDLLRELIDGIKNNFMKSAKEDSEPPSWIEGIVAGMPYARDKREIMEQKHAEFEKSRDEYYRYVEPSQILYLSGASLSSAVCDVLRKMGLNAEWKESCGRHDIEVSYKGFWGVVEVKGPGGNADVDDIRQLLDYWSDESGKNKSVKGIFIVNHYKDIAPNQRKDPYTKAALDLGKNKKFCLMTTHDLFRIHCDILRSKTNIETLIKTIESTNGLFVYID